MPENVCAPAQKKQQEIRLRTRPAGVCQHLCLQRTNDRLYYILCVWKQLGMAERDELHLTGELYDKEQLLPELKKFIRQVFIMNPAANLDLQAINLCE